MGKRDGAVASHGPFGSPGVHFVRERRVPGDVPLYAHPVWTEDLPWLVQGTTARGVAGEGAAAASESGTWRATAPGPSREADDAFDLRLFGALPVGSVLQRWRRLREAAGCPRAVHSRQVHGAELLVHEDGPPGLLIADGYDAHATRAPGVLLTVSVADCVPIFLVDPTRRAIALLHGGWRGVAAGVLERGVAALGELVGSAAPGLYAHFGPAICGDCYEVGPEVHEALGLEVPDTNTPVDLRAVLVGRALALGVPAERITASAFCTRCGDRSDGATPAAAARTPFFSHRGGCAERQVGVLGIRPVRDA